MNFFKSTSRRPHEHVYVSSSRNNQHNAQICTTALFMYVGSYMFRQ
jgi:hypothetical protein